MALRIWCCCCLALVLLGARAETVTPTPVQPWERTDILPARAQGKFPVMMPKYDGVDALLVLSSRWVIVVTITSTNQGSDGRQETPPSRQISP